MIYAKAVVSAKVYWILKNWLQNWKASEISVRIRLLLLEMPSLHSDASLQSGNPIFDRSTRRPIFWEGIFLCDFKVLWGLAHTSSSNLDDMSLTKGLRWADAAGHSWLEMKSGISVLNHVCTFLLNEQGQNLVGMSIPYLWRGNCSVVSWVAVAHRTCSFFTNTDPFRYKMQVCLTHPTNPQSNHCGIRMVSPI